METNGAILVTLLRNLLIKRREQPPQSTPQKRKAVKVLNLKANEFCGSK
jgi:hypothetical protein